jgi:hypothetical protein
MTAGSSPAAGWKDPPEPVAWTLRNKDKPGQAIMHGGLAYTTVTVGAPTSADVLKATAVQGASGLERTLRMVSAASVEQVPFEVLAAQPQWLTMQISDYMDEFAGIPAPDPLEAWRTARREARAAEAKAEAAEAAKAAAEAAKAVQPGPTPGAPPS